MYQAINKLNWPLPVAPFLVCLDVFKQQYTSRMKEDVDGNLDSSRVYSKKLFGPVLSMVQLSLKWKVPKGLKFEHKLQHKYSKQYLARPITFWLWNSYKVYKTAFLALDQQKSTITKGIDCKNVYFFI